MKLLATLTVAEVTNAIAAIRNMARWTSAGIRSFSGIARQIQRVFSPLPASHGPTLPSPRGGGNCRGAPWPPPEGQGIARGPVAEVAHPAPTRPECQYGWRPVG